MKYAWIDSQRRQYPLPDMCHVLAVSLSGYRAWKRGGQPERTRLTALQAVALFKSLHAEVKCAYGSRRMHVELQERGYRIGLRRMERLMREHSIRARHKRRSKATTDSRHSMPVADNQLTPEAPNRIRHDGLDEPQRQLLGQYAHRELLQQPQERTGAGTTYATRADVQAYLFEYIEVFYNRSRRHSTLGYSSPVHFLENWVSQQVDQLAKSA